MPIPPSIRWRHSVNKYNWIISLLLLLLFFLNFIFKSCSETHLISFLRMFIPFCAVIIIINKNENVFGASKLWAAERFIIICK